MDAKALALTISFAATAIALNAIRIPAVFWPGNFFQLSEIPVVIAFILFGVRIGVLVGVINLSGQLAFFLISPVYVVTYPMGFVAALLMLLGVYVACKFITRNNKSEKILDNGKKTVVYVTAFAVISRASIMPLIDYEIFFRLLLPIFVGLPFDEAYIVGLIPVFIVFNVITALYTVSVAYVVVMRVSRALKIEPKLLIGKV